MKKIEDKDLSKARSFITRANQVVVVSHYNPDGDAVGSSLGLCNYFKDKGVKAFFISPNDFPEYLKWMEGAHEAIVFKDEKEKACRYIDEADVIICLDFNNLDRAKDVGPSIIKSNSKKILIDHHPHPELFADVTISSENVSSTSELCYYFLTSLEQKNKITKAIAECFYTGIMTDTGCFSHGIINEDTFLTLAYLLSKGVDKDKIYYSVYDNYSLHRTRLLGYSLYKKLEVFHHYHAAFISLTKEELMKFSFVTGDTEGFVNLPFSIKEIRLAALFIEHNGYVKISFRSKGNFSVNEFARKHFNGGGHKNAAGGEAYMPLEEVLKKFRELLPKYSDELT